MRRPTWNREYTLGDRLVWQAASLLLAYPDDCCAERLDVAGELVGHVTGTPRALLDRAVAAVRGLDPRLAPQDYVETFDLGRRSTMYLTYWTAGETRNRGAAMHAFAAAYLAAGVAPPKNEAPDHLPVVLEFAATVDPQQGRRLLVEHRVPLDVLLAALTERDSPYANAVAAVCATLPAVTDQQVQRAQQLAAAGPPAEAVGLQPFTLTVPPRHAQGMR